MERLSELMWKGSRRTYPLVGALMEKGAESDNVIRACALGAAIFQVRGMYIGGLTDVSVKRIEKRTGVNLYSYTTHPVTGENKMLISIITSLNDVYNWSRERIADWLNREGK
jgi:hypothetical protein